MEPTTCRHLVKATLILFPLLGFTWVIGLFAVGPGGDVAAIIFVISNVLQVIDYMCTIQSHANSHMLAFIT